MTDLSAYIAVASLVRQRRVLVVHPDGPEGPRKLRDSGAARVFVISARVAEEPGISVRAAGTKLPLQSDSVDLVVCLDAIDRFAETSRAELISEMARVRRTEGLLVVRVPAEPAESAEHPVSFWDLRDQMAELLGDVTVLSQVPWSGFSFAAVVDDHGSPEEAQVQLREDLLEELPSASNYICLAGSAKLRREIARRCTLVPTRSQLEQTDEVPQTGLVPEPMAGDFHDELEQLREELAARSARVTVAEARVRELEQSIADGVNKPDRSAQILRTQELEQGLEQLRAELELSRRRLGLSEAQREELQARLSSSSADLDATDEPPVSKGTATAGGGAEQERVDAELEILERTLRARDGQLEQLEAELTRGRQQLAVAEARGQGALEELAELRRQVQRRSRALDDAQADAIGLRDKVHRLTAELARARAEVTTAERGVVPADVGLASAEEALSHNAGLDELRSQWLPRMLELEAGGRSLQRALEHSEASRRTWEIRASIIEGAAAEGVGETAWAGIGQRIDRALAQQSGTSVDASPEGSPTIAGEELRALTDTERSSEDARPTEAELADTTSDDPELREQPDVREQLSVVQLELDRARKLSAQWARAYQVERDGRGQLRAEFERLHGMWAAERAHRVGRGDRSSDAGSSGERSPIDPPVPADPASPHADDVGQNDPAQPTSEVRGPSNA